MWLSLARNLGRSIAVLLVVTFVTFSLMFGNASGIAKAVLGFSATEEDVQAQVAKLGLDRPLLVQYGDWLWSALQGDLGQSLYTGESVTSALANRVPVTLALIVITLVFTAILSIALGVTAAVKGGGVDRSLQIISVAGTAIPSFIVAIALVYFFAIQWHIFPATGYVSPSESVSGWMASLALPVTALLIGAVAGAAQQFRTSVLDNLGKDFVRTLRARGINEREIILRNVLRNSAAPGLTALALTVIGLLGGAVFIEAVFALPGMGQLAYTAALISDVPVVMGTVLVTAVIVLVVNFLGDLGIVILNPKARTR